MVTKLGACRVVWSIAEKMTQFLRQARGRLKAATLLTQNLLSSNPARGLIVGLELYPDRVNEVTPRAYFTAPSTGFGVWPVAPVGATFSRETGNFRRTSTLDVAGEVVSCA